MTAPGWPNRWDGQWIWLERPPWSVWEAPPSPPPSTWNRVVFFRRTLWLEGPLEHAWARLTADSRFILTVNGVECARGPARSLPQRLAVSTVDLASLLRAGENVLGATVRFYGRANPWYRPAQPLADMGAGGFLFEAPSLGVVSDGSWSAFPAPYRADTPAPQNLPVEVIDGRAMPTGWELPGFGDSSWRRATVLQGGGGMSSPPADPFTALESADVGGLTAIEVALRRTGERRLVGCAADDPLAAWPPALSDAGADRLVSFDAGGETLATPWLRVRGRPGAVVDVYAGEHRDDRGIAVIEPRRYALRYVLGGEGEERVEALEAVGFGHLTVALRGDVEVVACGATERRQPRDAAVDFACDDPVLEDVWHACARTAELCATDALLDCPGREQRSWLGDLCVSGLVALTCGIDPRVLRRSLRIAAHSQRADGLLAMASVGDVSLQPITIPEFSLHWLRALRVYHRFSGDTELLRELLPTAAEVVASIARYLEADGLLHGLPGWTWVDWAQTERGDVNGAVNALWIATLDDHAALLDSMNGSPSDRARATELASRAREGFERLWDERRGVYVDTLHAGGRRGTRISQQTNAAAIAWIGTDRGRAERILGTILDPSHLVVTPTPADVPEDLQLFVQSLNPADFIDFDGVNDVVAAQPFFLHVVHQAMALCDRQAAIIESCRRWSTFLDGDHDTIGEYWRSPPPQASRCHVFSCTPAYDLVHHALGLQRRTHDQIVFEPHLGSLGRARGSLPTLAGLVTAEVDDHGARIAVPPGVTVEVRGDGDPRLTPQLLGEGLHDLDLAAATRPRENSSAG